VFYYRCGILKSGHKIKRAQGKNGTRHQKCVIVMELSQPKRFKREYEAGQVKNDV
jgi:hypothetical protein